MVLFLSTIEYSQHKTILTPFNVASWPFVLIIIYINTAGVHFSHYFPVTPKSQLFILLNLIAFFLAGQFVWFILKTRLNEKPANTIPIHVKKFKIFYITLLLIAISAGMIQVLLLLKSRDISFLGKHDFNVGYGAGPLAHLRMLGFPAFILLSIYSSWRRNFFIKLFTFIFLLFILISQVKYHAIIMLLSTSYLWFLNKNMKKPPFRKLIAVILMVFLLFYLSYLIGITAAGRIDDAADKIVFLTKHLELYLVAGPIALNSYLKKENAFIWGFSEALFNVPINVMKAFLGERDYIQIHYTQPYVMVGNIQQANVGTIFSVLYYSLGYGGSLTYMFILGLLVYFLMNRAIVKRGVASLLLLSWLLAVLTVSFFGYHFHLLLIWEVAFLLIVLPNTAEYVARFLAFIKRHKMTVPRLYHRQ